MANWSRLALKSDRDSKDSRHTDQAIERHNLINAQLTSKLEDADMAQVVSDLAKEETIFQELWRVAKADPADAFGLPEVIQ